MPMISGTWVEISGGAGSVGPQGPEGPQGERGETGETGSPGADGHRIFTGTGAPAIAGAPGDIYIDTATGDLWQFT